MSKRIIFEKLHNGQFMTMSIFGVPRYLKIMTHTSYVIMGKSFLNKSEYHEDFNPEYDDADDPENGFKTVQFDGGPYIQVGSIIELPKRIVSVKKIGPLSLHEVSEKIIFLDRVAAYSLTVEPVTTGNYK